MFAANTTFEVAELVRHEAQGFENRRLLMRSARPFLTWIVQIPFQAFVLYVSKRIDGVAQDLVRRAVWFQGISVQVERRSSSRALDPEFELVRMLDRTAAHAASLRDNTERLVASLKGKTQPPLKLAHSFHRVSVASSKLHDEIRAFRSVVLVHEARAGTFDSNLEAQEYFSANDPAFARLMESRNRMAVLVGSMNDGSLRLDPELLDEAAEAITATER